MPQTDEFDYQNRMDVKVQAPGIEKVRATMKAQQKQNAQKQSANSSSTKADDED